jgi:agmatinase
MSSSAYPDWRSFMATSFAGRRTFPLVAPETPSFMSQPVAKTAADLKGADVVVIGAPYVAAQNGLYAGVPMEEWVSAPKRVRQQSARYPSGYIQDFDLDVFEHIRLVDYGDAAIPPAVMTNQTPELILEAQAAVEAKVRDALRAGAVPVVIGQNSPCGSFAIAKPCAEHVDGAVGCISLDTHWDAGELDYLTGDPRIAGAASWKHKMYEFLPNMHPRHLVEIGERGMLEEKRIVRRYLEAGARFISSWELRTSLGIEGLVGELDRAYAGTKGVYVHFDMDVIGGAGPAPGDILGELAEPIGLTDYETIRIAHEIGRRGLTGMSFICIPPGSAVVYRVIVYIIVYLAAGLALRKLGRGA